MPRSLNYTTDKIQKKAIFQVWLDIKKFLRNADLDNMDAELKKAVPIAEWGVKSMAKAVTCKE
jgi:hypothetical protein